VRLAPEETEAIRTAAREVFGPAAEVRLFGSRADDARRGGDIDLHVEVPGPDDPALLDDLRFRFVDLLHGRLGEQRIDVVVHAAEAALRPIDRIAMAEGVRL
jgi:predicted nucleotidyltransferase